MAAKTTVVNADIVGRDQASPVFDRFGRQVRQTAKDTSLLTKASTGLIQAFGGCIAISTATRFLRESNAEARESEKVGKLTANVIKTTGGVANVTAGQVNKLANSISLKTGKDDEAIQTGANLLLTFKNVRNEAGRGSAIFDRATRAAVDLSASGFGSIDSASKQLGKALQDPVKGVTALSRAGVTFSQSQKDNIAKMVEQNNLLGAQKLILREVESQVKGSAEAQASAGDKAAVAYKNMQEAIGTALLPAVDAFSNAVAKHAVPAGEKLSAWIKSDGIPAAKEIGAVLTDVGGAALPLIKTGAEVAIDALQLIAPIAKDIAGAFDALPEGAQKMALLGGAAILLSNRMRTAGTNLSGFVTNLDKASVKSAAFRTGAGAIGLGLAAIQPAADKTNHALGVLTSTASGAALGFSVGGPWGAAIGGAGGALVGLMQKTDNTKKRMDVAAAATSNYANTFDEITNKATRATRALAATDLQKQGAFKLGKQLGIQADDLVDAAVGVKGAEKRLRDQLAKLPAGMEPFAALLLGQLGIVGDKIDTDKAKAKELNDAINGKTPNLNVNDLAGPKLDKVKDKADGLTKTPLEMLLGADPTPASRETAKLVAWINNQGGTVDADGNVKPGKNATKALLDWIKKQKEKVKVDANTGPATASVRAWLRAQRGKSVHIPIIGDFKLFGAEGGPVQGFDIGGAVRGPGGPKSDKVPAMLSNGEHVLNAQDVRLMGGQGGVLAFRRALNQRRLAGGGFASDRTDMSPSWGSTGPVTLSPATIRAIGQEFANAMQGAKAAKHVELLTKIGKG